MPIQIETLNTQVTILDGDLPLSDMQLDQLVDVVLKRLEQRQSEQAHQRQAARLRHQLTPAMSGEDLQ